MHWATTTNQPNQTGKKKFSMAPLNNMHKGHCWWQRLARPLSCLSRQISHLTRLPRLIRPSNTTDGTAKTLLKLIEVITRNHGHFAPVSQWIWTLRGFGPPPVHIRWRIWTPFAGLDSPTKLSFWASFISYLVTNSICKLFVDVLFNHNTTFLNKGKEKQPFRSNSAAFIIASRTVYARIRCEQTTAFELLKLLR